MATLVSPGVSVSVTDESMYASAGAGTVPMLVVASGEDKAHVSGTGTASGTAKAKAGTVQLVTSQFELSQEFGNPSFGNHGDELNEYGLLAAYSYLGASNAAYVVRADVNTTQLTAAKPEPQGPPANGLYWLDTANTEWGIFKSTAAGTGSWVKQTVTVGAGVGGAVGDVQVDTSVAPAQFHYNDGAWKVMTTAVLTGTVFVADHTSVPTAVAADDFWFKTSTPNEGFNPVLKIFDSGSNAFLSVAVTTAATAPTTTVTGFVWADTTAADAEFTLQRWNGSAFVALTHTASATAVTGVTTTGDLWYDETFYIDLWKHDGAAWVAIAGGNITLASTEPAVGAANNVWVDTNDTSYPAIYVSDGATWGTARDNSDQTTVAGVVFGDHTKATYHATTGAVTVGAVKADGGIAAALYPIDMILVNMPGTGRVVRKRDNTLPAGEEWPTESGNNVDGSGTFGRYAQRKVVVQGLQAAASGSTLREETVAVTLLAAPGYPELADELSTLNTDRKETAFVLVDSPFRKSPDEAVTWITNTTAAENGEDGLNTKNSSMAVYYPNALSTNTDGTTVMVPASHMTLRALAHSDAVSYPWFAPAGLTRGRVDNATGVGYLNAEGDFTPVALTNGQRDVMYNAYMNPIANFPDSGITLWGQKTLHGTSTALDRINVSRLVAYLRERFEVVARPFIFEQNDETTRANITHVFDSFMTDIMSKRGVYDFAVVCDGTNNTPARIDRNELYVDVAIEPTKSAEFIYIPIRIVATGTL
jgi:hypothetical protein